MRDREDNKERVCFYGVNSIKNWHYPAAILLILWDTPRFFAKAPFSLQPVFFKDVCPLQPRISKNRNALTNFPLYHMFLKLQQSEGLCVHELSVFPPFLDQSVGVCDGHLGAVFPSTPFPECLWLELAQMEVA